MLSGVVLYLKLRNIQLGRHFNGGLFFYFNDMLKMINF